MQVKSVSFKGNIIDSHGHMGYWSRDKNNCTPASILNVVSDSFETSVGNRVEKNEVECVLVSNLDCMDRKPNGYFQKCEYDGNLDLIEKCRRSPKLSALVVCEPSKGSPQNIERLLQEFPDEIFGFKMHATDSGIPADSAQYEEYMKLAQKYKKTCVFHSDSLDSLASPKKIYELAKKTPDVPVVLYHMSLAPSGLLNERPLAELELKGLTTSADSVWNHREAWNRDGISVVKEALEKKDANLFLEISWTKPETVVEAIKTVGAERVLFGTDIPLDPQKAGSKEWYQNNIKEIKQAIRNDKEITNAEEVIKKVFFDNSNNLFFKGNVKNRIKQAVQQFEEEVTERTSHSKNKIIALVSAALIIIGGVIFAKRRQNK